MDKKRKPWVVPSGTRVDPYTGEVLGMPYVTRSGRFVGYNPEDPYLYNWDIDLSSLPNALDQLSEVCDDAKLVEERVRVAAFQEAMETHLDLGVFSLKYAADRFELDNMPEDSIQFLHAIYEKTGIQDLDLFAFANELKSATERAIGYEIGERPLLSYQTLLNACGSFFLILGAIEVSDASPGFFDLNSPRACPQ